MTSRIEVPLGAPGPRAAIVALVVLVAALLSAVVISRPRAWSPQPPPPPIVVRVSAAPPVAAVTPTAPVLIDAIPWGRIERIEDAAGAPYRLPEPSETPVLLELPAGEWRVVLSNPHHAGERTCSFTLAGEERHHCLVEFERLSVDQYFSEAGWWR